MKYTELKAEMNKDRVEAVSAALIAAGFDSLQIDDPADVSDILEHKTEYRYDYINDELAAEAASGSAVITLYFGEDEEAQLATAKSVLSQFGDSGLREGEAVRVTEQVVDDNDWLYKWQEYFKPTRVTDRLVVKPTWEEYEPAVVDGLPELVIEIDPGMAFGTGTHETTSMCMRALEKALRGDYSIGGVSDAANSTGAKVLDVGCGSGILSIAAALLGAEQALGIEIDTDAVEVAKSNVELNHLSDRICVQYGDLTQGVEYTADIVVANLMADLVIMLTKDVARHLKAGGLYISSGILNEKEAVVSEAITDAGFRIEDVLHDGEWCAIVARMEQ